VRVSFSVVIAGITLYSLIIHVSPASAFRNSVFCLDLKVNSDCFSIHNKLIGFYNRGRECLLGGTNWVLKSDIQFGPWMVKLGSVFREIEMIILNF
jgi:hypothetical protein